MTVFYGSRTTAEFAWALGDPGMKGMAWLNFIAILFITKPAVEVLRDYEKQKLGGKNPVSDPLEAGIEHAGFWGKDCEKAESQKQNKDSPSSF